MLDSISDVATTVAIEFLEALTSVVDLRLQSRCPHNLVEFIIGAPVTPFKKLDDDIRPIAVGMVWRHLVSRITMEGVSKEMV